MSDHRLLTTTKLSPRSSHTEIEAAIEECTKMGVKEYKATGRIGNTRPQNEAHALEISCGLAVTDARRHAGDKVPAFK